MKYNLQSDAAQKKSGFAAFKALIPHLSVEWKIISVAVIAMLLNSAINLAAPFIIARAIDVFIPTKNFQGIVHYGIILAGLYIVGLLTSYAQTRLMGNVGQRVVFRLRNVLFAKLQSLPVSFFNQNKSGDLISRISSDTERINAFFAQSFVQFMGSIFIMIGSTTVILSIHADVALATLAPAGLVYVLMQVTASWIKNKNATSLKTLGSLSAEVQESIQNFKVIVASNRRDYFRDKFQSVNEEYYKHSIGAGFANTIFTPIYSLATHLAHLILLVYGVTLIMHGEFTVGLLVSFISYLNNFYNPLRQLAALWASFQGAVASSERINEILSFENDLMVIPPSEEKASDARVAFDSVTFGYDEKKPVLHDISLSFEAGKTYALVGPTGGGKTTTASLMARLFDPTSGKVYLNGRDIRSYTEAERAREIGFILQEPILFAGTVAENIVYGNDAYAGHTTEQLDEELRDAGFDALLARFDGGLGAAVGALGEGLSLGQRQLIAFMRAVLRKPSLLILDEATANIDTVTEHLLESVLDALPKTTTRVIIAHRLNTIENADEIYFVSGGSVTRAGSMVQALDLLLHHQKTS